MLKPGDFAPNFNLDATDSGRVSLSQLRGKKVVLYFYPRDMTPGCTTEACDFRDNHQRLRGAGVEVVGVSKDTIQTHEKFRGKYELPFTLVSDPDNRVASAYGAFGEKMMYGKTVMGTIRSTFLINEFGRVQQVWSPVRVKGHVDAVLAEVTGEQPQGVKKAVKKKAVKKKAVKKKAVKKKAVKKKAVKKKAVKKKAVKKKAVKKKAVKKKAVKKKAVKKKAVKKKAKNKK